MDRENEDPVLVLLRRIRVQLDEVMDLLHKEYKKDKDDGKR